MLSPRMLLLINLISFSMASFFFPFTNGLCCLFLRFCSSKWEFSN